MSSNSTTLHLSDSLRRKLIAEAKRRGLTILTKAKALSYDQWFNQQLPDGWSKPGHIIQIIQALEAVERGEVDRLAISMPPRHGKTETITARYPAFCLAQRPTENVLVTSYTQRLADRFGRRVRNTLKDAGLLADDATARAEFATTSGGTFLARGVGAPPTGVGFSRIIVDDPIKNREEADSQVYRERAWDWFSQDIYSRLEPGGAIIMVCTRWHHDDVMARAIASEPGAWHVINLPAISDDGQALWPERFSAESLERIRKVIGLGAFESLYQGNPTPKEGALFAVSKLAISDDLPECVQRVRRWDLAASSGKNDYTVGALLGKTEDGRCAVLDVQRFQLAPDERNQRIRQVAEMDGLSVRVIGPQDPGSAGVEAAQAFNRLLAGFSVSTVRETGDKATRADPFASSVGAGNVILKRADWNAQFIEELRQFPGGAHDDQVDAASGAYLALFNSRGIDYDAFADW